MAQLAETTAQAVTGMAGRAWKYLFFTLADEEYGIWILRIKRIIGIMSDNHPPADTPIF
jgi:chemotaxis signal transduction protein